MLHDRVKIIAGSIYYDQFKALIRRWLLLNKMKLLPQRKVLGNLQRDYLPNRHRINFLAL